jgi:hypothetical protein
MMSRLTANAGMASVIHRPIAKKSRKMTYTWESVKPGSLRRKVSPRDMTNERTKEIIALFRFDSDFSIFVCFKIFPADFAEKFADFAEI